ncbi:19280_t:CDS:1, partial [Funneliformis geosporum]
KGQSSSIKTSVSIAITSIYQSVFGSKTKYAGLSYLDTNQPETIQKLLEGIIFFSFIVELENITVFISCLSKITISNSDKDSHNYAASLFHKYRKVQSVFYQHV